MISKIPTDVRSNRDLCHEDKDFDYYTKQNQDAKVSANLSFLLALVRLAGSHTTLFATLTAIALPPLKVSFVAEFCIAGPTGLRLSSRPPCVRACLGRFR